MTKVVKKRVFVGLSGGVDSAVSATLLKKAGYDVTGVFIKAWTPPFNSTQGTRKQVCGWKEDRRSAMRAAAVLDIPFVTLNLEKEYKKEVVDYMVAEYKKGRTPNPDVMCNKEIKFGHFLKWALKNGADFVATGHYCQTSPLAPLLGLGEGKHVPQSSSSRVSSFLPSPEQGEGHAQRGVGLMEGVDKNKDQSYFLWTLTQDQLKHILFPIGHLQKPGVRKLAGKFGLPQEARKDSQGVCFLGQIDMKEFLKEHAGTKKGKVLNEKGEIVGEHDGAILYTIGERHGFKISNNRTESEPLYVISKDIKNNTLTVARRPLSNPSSLQWEGLRGEVEIADINLTDPNSLKLRGTKENLSCRVRYRGEKIKCKIEKIPLRRGFAGKVKVVFDKPQTGISPGQSLVLYNKEICLGGGIIQ